MPGKQAEGVTNRSFSCRDDLWKGAVVKAKAEGISLGAVLRDALAAFLAAPPP